MKLKLGGEMEWSLLWDGIVFLVGMFVELYSSRFGSLLEVFQLVGRYLVGIVVGGYWVGIVVGRGCFEIVVALVGVGWDSLLK